jgi:hypothetical protein
VKRKGRARLPQEIPIEGKRDWGIVSLLLPGMLSSGTCPLTLYISSKTLKFSNCNPHQVLTALCTCRGEGQEGGFELAASNGIAIEG